MSEKLTRTMAVVALSVALVALIIAGYALYLHGERTSELGRLSEALERALEVRPMRDAPLRPPRPALDDGED